MQAGPRQRTRVDLGNWRFYCRWPTQGEARIVRDVPAVGWLGAFLAAKKYRFLQLAYLALFIGLFGSVITLFLSKALG